MSWVLNHIKHSRVELKKKENPTPKTQDNIRAECQKQHRCSTSEGGRVCARQRTHSEDGRVYTRQCTVRMAECVPGSSQRGWQSVYQALQRPEYVMSSSRCQGKFSP